MSSIARPLGGIRSRLYARLHGDECNVTLQMCAGSVAQYDKRGVSRITRPSGEGGSANLSNQLKQNQLTARTRSV
jgi:hypothetical protein